MSDLEPLLTPTTDRFTMFPIQHDDIWSMYKTAVECFWRPEEINLSSDLGPINGWASLTPDEQYFVSHILAFFAASDGVVIENLGARFMNDVQISEARAFYAFQIAIETVHSETYSLLIDTLIKDAGEKARLFKAIESFPAIKAKADWAVRYIQDQESSFATRLVAFACIEGIQFAGSFCALYWLKKRGKMHGLTFSNELISRDEALHTEFAVLLYRKLVNKLSKEKIHEIIQEAVEIETAFICEALPCRLIGMNSNSMSQYLRFVADRLSIQLGYGAIYGDSNPFEWMELISVEGKTNFFERTPGEYALATKTITADTFDMDGVF
jgi:ribonucleoside-diphosphate reductase subunit M2